MEFGFGVRNCYILFNETGEQLLDDRIHRLSDQIDVIVFTSPRYKEHSLTTKALITEDNVDLQLLFAQVFTGAGFETHIASDGLECLQHLQQQLPDVMILDINMPHMSGLEVITHVRARQDAQHVKIIVVSGNHLAETTSEASLADLFLVKPVRPLELLTLANRLLQDTSA